MKNKLPAPSVKWDSFFIGLCDSYGANSTCYSRQIGAVLVRDKTVIMAGYNGPPRGYRHCENACPRKVAGFASGEGLELCPASHAERNAIYNAARFGISIKGCVCYLNTIFPCKECTIGLIQAGVVEVVAATNHYYDSFIQSCGNLISTRVFNSDDILIH